MYLIGSRALNALIDWPLKEETDWDFILEGEDFVQEQGFDFEPVELDGLSVCHTYDTGKTIETPRGLAKLASPLAAMLIKRSHLHRPINFAKHIRHYHELKIRYKNDIDSTYLSLLDKRTKLTKQKYGDRTPSLKKSKTEFFDDYVTKHFDHDDIHKIVAYNDYPMFERLKTDSSSVWCSRSLWEKFSHEDKIRTVREEAYVIGLERFLIPKLIIGEPHPPANFAFDWSLTKICTTLTSGWFRDFATENWPEIRNHNYDYLGKFRKWANI